MGRIDACDVCVDYGQGAVVQSVTAAWDGPGFTAIVGPSGSGKSTLLYALAGLELPTRGRVVLLGQDTSTASASVLSRMRLTQVGFVFQRADLVPELTLRENVALPLDLGGCSRREREKRVDEIVSRLDIEECARRRPQEVSGGQAQRAAIARAVVARPPIIFADEPTGALDSGHGEQVMNLLLEQTRECSATLLMVTHDEALASRGDRIIRLKDGRVVADVGHPHEVI